MTCNQPGYCSRNVLHRGPHGGFRSVALPASKLTPRENEAIRLLASGVSWADVCRVMQISRSTLAMFHTSALARYGATNRADLLRQLGWLVIPNGDAP